MAAATAAAAATADDDDDDTDTDRLPSLSSVRARAPVRRGSKLPAPPTTGKPNVWLSGLLSAPSLPSTSDVSLRRTAPAARGEPGCCAAFTRPRTSSMLDRDALPMPWIKLCVRARPSASDALDTETCELCRELALPEPEPELVFRERERGRKAPLSRAREVALPLREPSRDALGLGWEDGAERRPTESSRSRASSEPSGDGCPERDARSDSRSNSGESSEPMLLS